MARTFVIGVGMTPFMRPGASQDDYPQMAATAIRNALYDAGIGLEAVERVLCAYVYGDSCSGQRAVYEVGLTGAPVVNVNNNCASGASALYLAHELVVSGAADCALAVGFEKMAPGPLAMCFTDRVTPLDRHVEAMAALAGGRAEPMAPWLFARAGQEHAERYGTTAEQFALVAEKNHRHSVNNPLAQFRIAYTLDEILSSRTVVAPLTVLQCTAPSDGAAAAVVASERFVATRGLGSRAVGILAMAMVTDLRGTFESGSAIALVGAGMTREAARRAYEASGVGPEDVDVIELHDCFSTNEIISYEALGLCPEGTGGALVAEGATTYGGRWVVNPSGGLISKGHPLGATGIGQCAELVWQLRGEAGLRQVGGARIALQHNIGLGGAAVVALYGAPATP